MVLLQIRAEVGVDVARVDVVRWSKGSKMLSRRKVVGRFEMAESLPLVQRHDGDGDGGLKCREGWMQDGRYDWFERVKC